MAGVAGAVIFCAAATPSYAETFTSREFLTWPREAQRGYFQASIGMAGFIARENDAGHGACLERWYFSDTAATEDSIRSAMAQNAAYHPRAVIVALMRKACGPFDYARR
ncbi:MAG: hypothetical protein QNJ84_02205 [Alphaproteobacteria bacterium]|nr:hypothetical protein [Alphaproteobacteria bacterium]